MECDFCREKEDLEAGERCVLGDLRGSRGGGGDKGGRYGKGGGDEVAGLVAVQGDILF